MTPKEDVAASVVNDMSDLLDELNRLDGRFAVEAAGHPYGDLKTAMVSTIAATLDVDMPHAREVYELMRDNDMTLERAHKYWLDLTRYDRCCGACGQGYDEREGHRCDLDPAEDASWLLPAASFLQSLGSLMSVTFEFACGRRPRWIEVDERMVHANLGAMSLAQFIQHYNETEGVHEDLEDVVNRLGR